MKRRKTVFATDDRIAYVENSKILAKRLIFRKDKENKVSLHMYICVYVYIYMSMCLCVCVCVCVLEFVNGKNKVLEIEIK